MGPPGVGTTPSGPATHDRPEPARELPERIPPTAATQAPTLPTLEPVHPGPGIAAAVPPISASRSDPSMSVPSDVESVVESEAANEFLGSFTALCRRR